MNEFSNIFSNTWGLVLVALFFGGSIFIHELGHFLAARIRGLKVLRFSIGFGPRIFSWKGKDGCEYILSLLPFGGYVALPQLADMGKLEGADNDDDQTKNLPKASCTDKIIVSAAGAFFNILLAIVIATIIWIVGIEKNVAYQTTIVGYVNDTISDISGTQVASPAKLAGIKAGDKIVSIDGNKVDNFEDIIELIAIGSGRNENNLPLANIEILRDGETLNITTHPALISTNLSTGDKIRMIGITPYMPTKVGDIMPNSPAEKAGLKKGDEVIKVDNIPLYSAAHLADYLDEKPENTSVDFTVLRDANQLVLSMQPKRINLTKSLCEISTKDGKSTISFLLSNKEDRNAKTGIIKVFSMNDQSKEFKNFNIGDIVYEVNSRAINNLSDLNTIVNGSSQEKQLNFSLMNINSEMRDISMPKGIVSKIKQPENKVMCGYMIQPTYIISHPSVYEQFKSTITKTYNAMSSLINPKSDIGISSLAGPVDIGRVIYKLSLTDIMLLLSFAVLLNVNLAIINMLPLPVLDGGHIIFAIIEKIRGKPLPPTFFMVVQGTFSILLLSLMLYVVYSGSMRWSGDNKYQEQASLQSEYYLTDISF